MCFLEEGCEFFICFGVGDWGSGFVVFRWMRMWDMLKFGCLMIDAMMVTSFCNVPCSWCCDFFSHVVSVRSSGIFWHFLWTLAGIVAGLTGRGL